MAQARCSRFALFLIASVSVWAQAARPLPVCFGSSWGVASSAGALLVYPRFS